jgi:hypothetical protein
MVDSVDLGILLSTLKHPAAHDGRMAARQIPGYDAYRLAKSATGDVALLISAAGPERGLRPPPITLEHLSVQHDIECRLEEPGGAVYTAQYTVVQLKNSDRHLASLFVKVLGPFLLTVGPQPSRRAVTEALQGLVDLFRALERPPRKSVQGLWAELLFIATAPNAVALVEAWHATGTDRFDFSSGIERIEVKSVSGSVRAHHFSHEQLRPPEPVQAIVWSVLLDRAASGCPLQSLIEEVRGRVASSPTLVAKIDRVLAELLGAALPVSLDIAFDREAAVASVRVFRAWHVPAVDVPVSDRISALSYVVDLSDIPASTDLLSDAGPLVAAAIGA